MLAEEAGAPDGHGEGGGNAGLDVRHAVNDRNTRSVNAFATSEFLQ